MSELLNPGLYLSKRLFFGLAIPDEDQAFIIEWMKLSLPELKTVKRSNLHLTLAFYPKVSADEQKALINFADQLANNGNSHSFDLSFQQLDCWQKSGILYLKPDSEPAPLNWLAGQLRSYGEMQDLYLNPFPFRPHITLSRKAKQIKTWPNLNRVLKIHFSHFYLFESCSSQQGVVYTPLASWPLFSSKQ